MIVFNLGCKVGHTFEGWFASVLDFDQQSGRGLLNCPVCGSTAIEKKLAAPYLNLKSATIEAGSNTNSQQAKEQDQDNEKTNAKNHSMALAKSAEKVTVIPENPEQALRLLVRQIIDNTEDVGDGFVDEVRRMHYEEIPLRPVRGIASIAEAEDLHEEGIDVLLLPGGAWDKSGMN